MQNDDRADRAGVVGAGGMQDGGAPGIFTKAQGNSSWSVKFGTFPFPCPGGPVPDYLVKFWGLSYPSGCGQG